MNEKAPDPAPHAQTTDAGPHRPAEAAQRMPVAAEAPEDAASFTVSQHLKSQFAPAYLTLVIAGLCIAAWALYDVLHLGQAQPIIAMLALISSGAFLASSIPGWNSLLMYARNER